MADTFALDIARFVQKAQGNIDLVVRKVAFDLFAQVIIMSPVDTGRFRANWQVAINSVPPGTVNAFDKTGSATLSRVQATVNQMKAGDVISLINSLPYSVKLEYGWSKQAPAGMVRITVASYSGVVQTAANSVPK